MKEQKMAVQSAAAPNKLFNKADFKKEILENIKLLFRKTIDNASQEEIFQAVSLAAKDIIVDEWLATHKKYNEENPKIVYYLSMEFLIGRALGNNLINLRCYKEVAEVLDEMGIDINVIEDQEPDPALGNGGLGRLAACFLDSLSTLGYPRTDAVSVINTVFSNRRSKMAIRWKCRITG